MKSLKYDYPQICEIREVFSAALHSVARFRSNVLVLPVHRCTEFFGIKQSCTITLSVVCSLLANSACYMVASGRSNTKKKPTAVLWRGKANK